MNLLVGATGFIGGHLVEYLFKQGEISKGLFRKGAHLKILDTNGVQGIEGDVLDHHSLHEAMEGVDSVYNLASPTPEEDSEFEKANTEGILNLLEVAGESGVKTFVHLSTLDVYGFSGAPGVLPDTPAPMSPYQKAKSQAERVLMEHAKRNPLPKIVVIRASKAIGSRDPSFVIPVLRSARSGRVTIPDSGVMSFAHPIDIAQSMYKAATGSSKSGSTYLLKSFDSTPTQAAESMIAESGLKAQVRRPGILGGSDLSTYTSQQLKASRRFDAPPNWSELGYAPAFDLKATSVEVADWYRKDPWLGED